MTVIEPNLFCVVKRFPGRKRLIFEIFKKNSNFQAICDDYRQCSEALARWKQSASEEAPARKKEYSDLLQELELEILQILNEIT
jgi:hypothetical protein